MCAQKIEPIKPKVWTVQNTGKQCKSGEGKEKRWREANYKSKQYHKPLKRKYQENTSNQS